MSDKTDPIASRKPLSWRETWIKALTQISETSYAEIADDPGATFGKAVAWIFLSNVTGNTFVIVIGHLLSVIMLDRSMEGILASTLKAILYRVPFNAVMIVLGVVISVGLLQWTAGMLGGTGTYPQLLYTAAAYIAPLMLGDYLLKIVMRLGGTWLPLWRYRSQPTYLLGLYASLYLNIIAIKAVNKFRWRKAIVSSLLPPIILSIIAAIVLYILSTVRPEEIWRIINEMRLYR